MAAKPAAKKASRKAKNRRKKTAVGRKAAAASAAAERKATPRAVKTAKAAKTAKKTAKTAKKTATAAKGAKRTGPAGPTAREGRATSSRGSRKPPAGKRRHRHSILETALESALESVTRTIARAARRVTRALPPRSAGRPAPARGRSGGPRPRSPTAGPTRPGRRVPSLPGIVIRGAMRPRYDDVLTPDALAFVAELHRRFDARRRELLAARRERQQRYDSGELPDFLAETRHIRSGEWKIAPIPKELTDRRVEITGPVDRKMIINALNSGANVFMADFEDANSPTWANCIEGQINLEDRWAGLLDFTDPESGKRYTLGPHPAVLIVRPRGWHMVERHLTVDGEPVSAAMFDFALAVFHNGRAQIAHRTAPYFYLPKLEAHQEARLWNDVFVCAEELLHFPLGTIKATVLIETLPAAFEMDEILWELRDHVAGLNAGRWDYIFSFIKTFAKNPDFVLPDRGQLVMGEAFLHAYALLLIKTCHRRGAFAMGGMAAQIPVRGDPRINEAAFAKVREDKEREARDGHDGTWVAHPDLVPVAKDVFDRMMPQKNQLDRLREDVEVTRDDLLRIPPGTRTEAGFRLNIRVGVQYIEAWLRGRGAVPIYNLMEDAATAEISRAQIWQWIKYRASLEDGVTATPDFFARALTEEMEQVKREVGASAYAKGRFREAIALFRDLSLAEEFEDFLTIPAYRLID